MNDHQAEVEGRHDDERWARVLEILFAAGGDDNGDQANQERPA